MQRDSSVAINQEPSECVKSTQVGSWNIQLLPHAPYETCYTPEQSIIGFSFDSQVGTHAFASDKKKEFQAMPNGLAWVPSGCDVYSQSSGGEYLKISCSHAPYRIISRERYFSNVINPAAINAAYALRRALLSVNCIDELACENWLVAMESSVFSALRGLGNPDKSHGWMDKHRFRKIDEVIEARLDTQLTVSELAGEFGISAGFFSREFKSAVGTTPHQYIIDKRLTIARMRLNQSKQDLSAIAFASGFSSHSHMTARFKEKYGVTPVQLRRK